MYLRLVSRFWGGFFPNKKFCHLKIYKFCQVRFILVSGLYYKIRISLIRLIYKLIQLKLKGLFSVL